MLYAAEDGQFLCHSPDRSHSDGSLGVLALRRGGLSFRRMVWRGQGGRGRADLAREGKDEESEH